MKKIALLFLFFICFATIKATTINVDVSNFAFTPVSFDAAVGDTVTWTLVEGTHTTTSTSVPAGAATWNYAFSGVGDTFSYVITVAGVYEYHCLVHPTTMIASFSTSLPLPFVEDFDYPADDNITMHGWVAHSAGGTNPITVNNGGLTFPDYLSSGIGNAALLSGNSEDDHRLFDSQTSGSVYAAFMVNVTDNPNGYFLHFGTNSYSFDYRGRVYLEGTNPNLEFGLAFATEAPVITSNSYVLGTTYLLVLKYSINASTGDDEVSLYVFDGSFPNIEPSTPTIGPIVNSGVTDIDPGAISFRKYNASQDLIVDGIRIGTTWSDVLPVELSSFAAVTNENNVTLNWVTKTEINNSGFEIERKSISANSSWNKIGFVQGNGTTTKENNYSYTDNNLNEGKYAYRLKQIDFNGTYKYSNTVNADISIPAKFELSQNYPNPFNPSTTINYSLAKDGIVSLAVYNLLGQQVASLVNGNQKAGAYHINFDASKLSSGVYYYRLESNNNVMVKKMLLMK